jgi:hypothetical protein
MNCQSHKIVRIVISQRGFNIMIDCIELIRNLYPSITSIQVSKFACEEFKKRIKNNVSLLENSYDIDDLYTDYNSYDESDFVYSKTQCQLCDKYRENDELITYKKCNHTFCKPCAKNSILEFNSEDRKLKCVLCGHSAKCLQLFSYGIELYANDGSNNPEILICNM